MLDVLDEFLQDKKFECSVKKWLNTQPSEAQEKFALVMNKIQSDSSAVYVSHLYQALSKEEALPFKHTSFRNHVRGNCTCQK